MTQTRHTNDGGRPNINPQHEPRHISELTGEFMQSNEPMAVMIRNAAREYGND